MRHHIRPQHLLRDRSFPARPATVVIALTIAVIGSWWWPAGSATGDPDTFPQQFPSFRMELQVEREGQKERAVIDYESEESWTYEVYSSPGNSAPTLTQELHEGRVTIWEEGFGSVSYPADPGLTVPAPWFISSLTAVGRGAERLGSSPSFDRTHTRRCAPADRDFCRGADSARVRVRMTFDPSTGIPVGYEEHLDGDPVLKIRATSLVVR